MILLKGWCCMSACLIVRIWDGGCRCVDGGKWIGSEWCALYSCSLRIDAYTVVCERREEHVWESA